MKLYSEIAAALGAEGLVSARVQYTVISGRGGYFQNVRRLLEFSETKIVLSGKKGRVVVEGENLSLGKCFSGDVAVLGNIRKVEGEE